MSIQVMQPEQYLAIGTLKLPFPSPDLTVEEVVSMYQLNYPVLADADISKGIVQGDTLVYEATPPPVKTKGRNENSKTSLGHRLVRQRNLIEAEADPTVVARGRNAKSIQGLIGKIYRPTSIKGNRLCLPPW